MRFQPRADQIYHGAMKVLYFAAIRDRMKVDAETVDLPKRVTVGEFYSLRLASRLSGVDPARLLFAVNEEFVESGHLLSDGDTLAILPPLSGGAKERLDARIQIDDFNIDQEIGLCVGNRSGIGGIATFIGVVRDVSKGKPVERIEISCYEEMAEKELHLLRARALERFDVANVTIVHRIGTLRVGERIVGIVAAAAHRDAAFEACRWTIDELKRKVPLWKKEITPDGETWVEWI